MDDLIFYIAILIVIIVQIAIIRKFFQIAADIRQIKYGKTGRDYLDDAEMYLFADNKIKALESYKKSLYRFTIKGDTYANAQRDITNDIILEIKDKIKNIKVS